MLKALRQAGTTMRRTPYQSLAATLTVMVTFIVAFSLSLLMLGAQVVVQHFETQPQVIAFFTLGTKPEEISEVLKKISALAEVKEAKVVSQQDALKLYQEANRDDPLLLELVTADILPASIEVSSWKVEALTNITKQLTEQKSIDDVIYPEDVVEVVANWTKALRTFGLVAATTLGVISFLTIFVLIGLKATAQKKAINIMRIIGANRAYVRLPFVFEGALYGLVGALIAWLINLALIWYFTPSAQAFLQGIINFPLPYQLLLIQLGAGLAVGGFLGGLAGLAAVSRLMRN